MVSNKINDYIQVARKYGKYPIIIMFHTSTSHYNTFQITGCITTRHIKQVASDPQVPQINLMRQQCRDLPASKHKKRKPFVKPGPLSHKNDTSDRQSHYKKSFDAKNVYRNKERCQKCGDSNHIEGFQCPAKKFQCKSKKPKAHMLQAGAVYACHKSISGHSEDCSSSDESFCLQVKIQ